MKLQIVITVNCEKF